MRWIDLHCDTLSELYKEAGNTGQMKEGVPKGTLYRNDLCVDIERLLRAGAQAQFFACFVNAADYGKIGADKIPDPDVWDRAYKDVLRMLELAHRAECRSFYIPDFPASSGKSGSASVRDTECGADSGKERKALEGILTVEEGGVLNGSHDRLEELYRRGVRLVTLTWNYENCLGSPNSRNKEIMGSGLKPFGFETVERMNELGMVIDVSHLSDGGFWDCIRTSRKPIAASHSNARALCPHPRNLTDEMLHALGENGGVAGVNFYSAFLRASKDSGVPAGITMGASCRPVGEVPRAGIEDILRHLRYIMNKAGEDAAAFGTDLDGFGRESLPEGIKGAEDMEKIWEAMKKSGFTARQIEKAAYGNAARVLRDVCTFPADASLTEKKHADTWA